MALGRSHDHLDMVWRLIGTALQLVGLGLAAYGVSQTRQTYAPDQLGIAGTVRRRVWRWYMRVRRWIGRPLPPVELRVDSAMMTMSGGEAGLDVMYKPLAADWSTEQKLEALDRRTRADRGELNRLGKAVADEKNTRKTEVKRLQQALAGESQQRQQEISRAMAGGLRLESSGLGMAALGTFLAALG
jgi:hypothetical protein